MFTIVEKLIATHGIANVMVSIKPHGESIAATINLIPDSKAIPDQDMQAALAVPIVLIGKESLEAMSVESVLAQVRSSLSGHRYFNPAAISARIRGADLDGTKATASTTAPAASRTPKKPAPEAQKAITGNDLFSEDSL